jgi:diacylglycerol kinase family enzyme
MRRRALIVNPFASRVTEARLAAVQRVLRAAGPLDTLRTERRGHATELAREVEEDVEAIYVFSGDGGYNEVLNGVRGRVPLGFVPGGGTSVLPRALGLPPDPVTAATRLARGRERRISLGRVDGRRFGFTAGIGLDAELVRRVDELGRAPGGRRAGDLAFLLTALRVLLEHRVRFDPVLEVRPLGRAAFALVSNADPYTYAGPIPLHVAPKARFELGLDVVAPRRVRPSVLPRFLAYALTGRGQDRASDVLYGHDLDRFEIACDRPLPLQVDGEDLGDVTEATVECERAAVTVLV